MWKKYYKQTKKEIHKIKKKQRNTFSYDKKIITAFTLNCFFLVVNVSGWWFFFTNMKLFFFSFIYFYSADKCVLIYCLDVVGTTAGLSIGVLIFYFDETLRELLTEVKGYWWLLFVVLHLSQRFAGGHISLVVFVVGSWSKLIFFWFVDVASGIFSVTFFGCRKFYYILPFFLVFYVGRIPQIIEVILFIMTFWIVIITRNNVVIAVVVLYFCFFFNNSFLWHVIN